MLKIIEESKRIKNIRYFRSWKNKEDQTSGYCFPCDINGKIDPLEYEEGRKNLIFCQTSNDVIDEGILIDQWTYFQPAQAECKCGKIITLDGDSMGECECECGRFYNVFGQLLAGKIRPFNGQNDDGEYYYEEDAY